jgi:hypothetical protein
MNLSKYLGLIKMKGELPTIHPTKFSQMKVKCIIPYELLKKEMICWVVVDGIYWVICRENAGEYCKVPFAKNELWFREIVSEVEFMSIAKLPQVYVTGLA